MLKLERLLTDKRAEQSIERYLQEPGNSESIFSDDSSANWRETPGARRIFPRTRAIVTLQAKRAPNRRGKSPGVIRNRHERKSTLALCVPGDTQRGLTLDSTMARSTCIPCALFVIIHLCTQFLRMITNIHVIFQS